MITTVEAKDIVPGQSLWVTASGNSWVGPTINSVSIADRSVTIRTVNGGQRRYDLTELVEVVDSQATPLVR